MERTQAARTNTILTMNTDSDTERLLREGLNCADVLPLVQDVYLLNDQHPVVDLLVKDGVPGITTECHLPHCEEIQGASSGH